MTADPFAFLDSRVHEPVRWHEAATEESWYAMEVMRRSKRIDLFAALPPEQRLIARKAENQLCALDPFHFIEQHIWIQDPQREEQPLMREMPLVLWDAQREVIERSEEAIKQPKGSPLSDLVIIKSREMGISWTMQAWLFWRFCYKPNSIGFCLSRTETEVDNFTTKSLFGKFRFMYKHLPGFVRPKLTRNVKLHIERGETKLIGESTNKDALRGGRGGVVLLDEFAAIDPPKQELTYMATETVARARIFVSTPKGYGNRFAKLVQKHSNVLRIPWNKDPRRTEEWAAAKREQMGPRAFDQEFGAQLTALAEGLIWDVHRPSTRYGEGDMKPEWRKVKPIVGGWDFGSGPSLLVCLFSIMEFQNSGRIRLWIDDELTWSRTAWQTAAADTIRKQQAEYGGDVTHYGDPAGIAADSAQTSWQVNLRAGGVNLFCLPGEFNEREEIEWGYKIVQRMLSMGELRIHDRCEYLWRCVENWERAVPAGQSIDFISRAYIPAKHDIYSHGGMALVYLVRAALRQAEARKAESAANQEAMQETMAAIAGRSAAQTVRDLRVGRHR